MTWQVASKLDGHATFYLLNSIVGSAVCECGQFPGISDDWFRNFDLLLGERERDLHAWALLNLKQVSHLNDAILQVFASENDCLSEETRDSTVCLIVIKYWANLIWVGVDKESQVFWISLCVDPSYCDSRHSLLTRFKRHELRISD